MSTEKLEGLKELLQEDRNFIDKVDCNFSEEQLAKINKFKKRRGDIEMSKKIDYQAKLDKSGKKLFSGVTLVNTKKLKINPYQKNWFSIGQSKASEKPEHLTESIKKYGIKTPVKITKDYLIIGGHRRHQIALQLGLEKIPCQIANYDLTDDELKLHTIEDNYLQRELGSSQKKAIYSDLIGLVKKEFPNWEYMIREDRGKLQQSLESLGLSTKTAEKISIQERRKAHREDSARIKGVIQTDYHSMIKNANNLAKVYEDTNKETKNKAKPEILRLLKNIL